MFCRAVDCCGGRLGASLRNSLPKTPTRPIRETFVTSNRTDGPRALNLLVVLAQLLLLSLIFVCSPERAQALDPKCTNRAATGAFICVIDQPNVTQPETVIPAVEFVPGDVVDILADGCVQTGGSGDTWKRYVNPTGDGVDHLYHGLIRIPSAEPAGSGLVRVEDVIGHPQKVTGTGFALSQLVLSLGYEDDNYSDNGYYSHDDGNDDQCKNDSGHGGPAQIRIYIYRGVAAPPFGSRFDFDVLSSAVDSNLLPYNPHWSWQERSGNQGKVPDTGICHNFSKSPVDFGTLALVRSPNFPDCTDQTDPSKVDQPTGANQLVCGVGGLFESDSFPGHVNWFPVTLEGHAGWGGEETDDDNSFTFTSDEPGDPLGVVGHPSLHVEFDSDETTKRFTSDEWKTFHGWVNTNNDDLARQYFDGHTIITGMFGLDSEHDLKSEIHPLYAMATKRDNFGNDATHEDWLMFVRNLGDEGFCSSTLWEAGFEDYTFRLPWLPDMKWVDVDWDDTQFEGTNGTSGPTVAAIPAPLANAGVYVTFHLGPASNDPYIDGSLKLVWTPGIAMPGLRIVPGPIARVTTARPAAPAETESSDEIEQKIGAVEASLTPAQRGSVQTARLFMLAPPGVYRLPRGVAVQKIAAWPPFAGMTRPGAIKAGPATVKLQRDRAQIQAVCTASHNAPPGLPAGVCAAAARPAPTQR
jgi:hypothetical protein